MRAESPCEPTWQNFTGRHLQTGGESPPLTGLTSEQCVTTCIVDRRADCVAVQYYRGSAPVQYLRGSVAVQYYRNDGDCVVHVDESDLDNMEASDTADVYVIVRCNTTGIRLHTTL